MNIVGITYVTVLWLSMIPLVYVISDILEDEGLRKAAAWTKLLCWLGPIALAFILVGFLVYIIHTYITKLPSLLRAAGILKKGNTND